MTKTIIVGTDANGVNTFGVLEGGKLIHATREFSSARDVAGEDAPFEDWQGRPLIHPTELRKHLAKGNPSNRVIPTHTGENHG